MKDNLKLNCKAKCILKGTVSVISRDPPCQSMTMSNSQRYCFRILINVLKTDYFKLWFLYKSDLRIKMTISPNIVDQKMVAVLL